MDWPYELQIGWRYTRAGRSGRRNRFISFISAASMAGIALGVAALIIVLSVMNGFRKEVRDRMLSVVSHVEVGAAGGEALADWRAIAERVRRHPQVAPSPPSSPPRRWSPAATRCAASSSAASFRPRRRASPSSPPAPRTCSPGSARQRQRRPRRGAGQGAARQGGRQGQPGPAGRRLAPPAWCRAWARSPSPAPSMPATSSTTTAWPWCISTTRSGCSSSPARTALRLRLKDLEQAPRVAAELERRARPARGGARLDRDQSQLVRLGADPEAPALRSS